jgi:hypothetical protein
VVAGNRAAARWQAVGGTQEEAHASGRPKGRGGRKNLGNTRWRLGQSPGDTELGRISPYQMGSGGEREERSGAAMWAGKEAGLVE